MTRPPAPLPIARRRPRLAVWKFASCDGCQLTLLDCERELLAIADRFEIAHFLEASSRVQPGPYDVSIVEGSITTEHDRERIHEIRRQSRLLVTIGACATAGGIQALRNTGSIDAMRAAVYPRPEWIDTLAHASPIAAHVRVDFELRGCPIDRTQLLDTLVALLQGRAPQIERHSVCMSCKRAGLTCVLVAHGTPCLGPVTQAGCGALCPAHDRGCYGCFGPHEDANVAALAAAWRAAGIGSGELARALRSFNAEAPAFRQGADALDRAQGE